MKFLTISLLITYLSTALATEITNNNPSVDHSAIFKHATQTTTDTKSMRQSQAVSVINTKGYTYIEVTQNDEPVWLAVPTTNVKAGDTVHYTEGPLVQNYHSPSLDKTFDTVIFLLSVVVN